MLWRVLFVTLFLGVTLLTSARSMADLYLGGNALNLGMIIATYLLTIAYALTLKARGPSLRLAHVQIAFDLVLTSVLVASTGGFHTSVFLFALYLPIIATALISSLRAAMVTASIVALVLLLMLSVYLGLPAPASLGFSTIQGSVRELLLEAGLDTFFTYLLAWSAGQLARQLGEAKTELARGKLDLEELRALNQDILASLNSGLLTIDASQRIIFFNTAAEKITGLQADAVFAQPLSQLFPELPAHIKAIPSEGAPQETRHELSFSNTPEEAPKFLGFSISPLRDASGEHTGHIVIFQDLSRYKELEQLAKRNEKLAAIGQLSAAIAHEIRNPLASISGSVEMLQALASLSEDEQALMGIIIKEVDRLNELISQFLDYTRPKPLHLEDVEVSAFLEEVVRLFRFGAERAIIETSFSPEIDTLQARFDPEALKSVLLNLLLNAAEAMHLTTRRSSGAFTALDLKRYEEELAQLSEPQPQGQQPRIILRASRLDAPEPLLLLEVEDDGPGIPPEVAEHIFEPFFTTKTSGTGLGLATSFRLIEEHEGDIVLTSPHELSGARFAITLPLSSR